MAQNECTKCGCFHNKFKCPECGSDEGFQIHDENFEEEEILNPDCELAIEKEFGKIRYD